jgi:hypothetical protein
MTPKKGKGLAVVEPLEVKEAKLAADAEPGSSAKGTAGSDPNEQSAEESEHKTSWIEVKLIDGSGAPVPGERFRVTTPDGRTRGGTLDHEGFARVEGIDPGTCQVTFPRLDAEAWEPA